MRRAWTLNGDFLAFQATGLARYARSVTAALDALLGEGHPLARELDLTLISPRDPSMLALRNIAGVRVRDFDKPRIPQLWVQARLPRHVRGGLVSFCNLAPIVMRRHIVCIHDLYSHVAPLSHGRGKRIAYRVLLPIVGRRARYITTVSRLSREHLIAYGIAPAERIHVTENGADHALTWSAERSRLRLPTGPFVLCIGRDQEHKNTGLFWRLAPLLAERGIDVVMAGYIGSVPRPAQLPSNLRLVGEISDDDLAAAMDRALCFALPSRIEGFGLPAVEAMARGCALVASTARSLPEVCGDAALYADPDDVAAWLGQVARLREDAALRAALVERGRERAARYTWRAVAEKYLELMEEIDRERA